MNVWRRYVDGKLKQTWPERPVGSDEQLAKRGIVNITEVESGSEDTGSSGGADRRDDGGAEAAD